MANLEVKQDVHYVATLKIERVYKPGPRDPNRIHVPESDRPRDITELTMVTLKTRDLEDLTEAMRAHIAIIEKTPEL